MLRLFCFCFALAISIQAAQRPNFVFILADDLGWADVSFNGRKEWKTPNLDHLAKQGTKFERWYTAGVVCAPSRAALMTGKYTIHCRVSANNDDLPREETTLAEALKPLGYRSALIGKWHHGARREGETNYVHPLDHGFDRFIGYVSAREAWEHFPTNLWFGREKRPVSGYSPTILTDHAIEFLREQKKSGEPFFLYQAYIEPHLHIEAPEEDVRKFAGKFEEVDEKEPSNARYAAMITRMDREIGRLLDELDRLGLAKETIVVFTSDHGATFEGQNRGTAAYHDSNAPFRGHKRTVWEGGTRVPAVVRWPGKIPGGKVSQEIVHMIDVFPTLLAAAGNEPRAEWRVDGANMLAVWQGKAKGPERTLFWEWRSEQAFQLAAMRGNFKLVIPDRDMFNGLRAGEARKAELYDLSRDPAERRTIAFHHPAMVTNMVNQIFAWLETEVEPADALQPRTYRPRRGQGTPR